MLDQRSGQTIHLAGMRGEEGTIVYEFAEEFTEMRSV
jgi:hypothetical protein